MSSYFVYPAGSAGATTEPAFLGGRAEEDWERIAREGERVRFRAGEDFVRAGEVDRALYVVLSGRLEVRIEPPVLIDAGCILGELAFLDGEPRSATVRAVADGEALRLDFDGFERLAARHAELGRAILLELGRIVAGRLRRANKANA